MKIKESEALFVIHFNSPQEASSKLIHRQQIQTLSQNVLFSGIGLCICIQFTRISANLESTPKGIQYRRGAIQ